MNGLNEFKRKLGVRWVKSDSGNTYLCPIGIFDKQDNPTEEQMKMLCVEESANPHND